MSSIFIWSAQLLATPERNGKAVAHETGEVAAACKVWRDAAQEERQRRASWEGSRGTRRRCGNDARWSSYCGVAREAQDKRWMHFFKQMDSLYMVPRHRI